MEKQEKKIPIGETAPLVEMFKKHESGEISFWQFEMGLGE